MRRYLPVDGLRAISVLWMVAFHTLFFAGFFLPVDRFRQWMASPWTRIISQGHFGVDIFFIISGFLIGSILIGEVQETGTLHLGRFYVRRFFRIFPIYGVIIAFYGLCEGPGFKNAWANLLMVNNFLGIREQFMGWTWSLAIEEQFYLIFPLLLLLLYRLPQRFAPNRFRFLLIIFLVSPLIQAWMLKQNGFIHPFSPHPAFAPEEFARYFDTVYERTYCRYGGILAGVLVALLVHEKNGLEWLRQNPRKAKMGLAFSALSIAMLLTLPAEVGSGVSDPSPAAIVTFLASYRFVFTAAMAFVLFFVLGFSSQSLARALSAKIWRPVAELSYGAYLIHPILIRILWPVWIKLGINAPWQLIAPVLVNWLLTFGIAYPLYRWIELPCRDFGRRYAVKRKSLESLART